MSPTPTSNRAASATFLFVFIFTIALFPNLFIATLKLPFALIPGFGSKPTKPTLPICSCIPPPSATSSMSSAWFQKTITLPAASRGSYLVTDQIVSALPELKSYRVGLLNLFVQHTSCALSLNENWDEDVRADMTDALDRIVEEDKGSRKGLYRHDAEGSDDMPAHIKSALIGASVTIPIRDGKLATGTWQGIWYLEFRNAKHSRKIVATIQGEKI